MFSKKKNAKKPTEGGSYENKEVRKRGTDMSRKTWSNSLASFHSSNFSEGHLERR